MTAIRLNGIVKNLGGFKTIDGLSLEVKRGERLVIFGPSGAGKTTLLRIIAGLENVDEGTVEIDGQLATERKTILIAPHQRNLSLFFQDLGLWPNVTVRRNIALGLGCASHGDVTQKQSIEALAENLRISALLSRKPGCLSAGEQQRVALARALVPQKRILLLDEPFAALDCRLKEEVYRVVTQSAIECGTTMVIVTHDQNDAIGVQSTRTVVLEGGRFCHHN